MTNLQDWLNNKNKQEKKNLKELEINGNISEGGNGISGTQLKELSGIDGGRLELDLRDFLNLERISIDGGYLASHITDLILSNCHKLTYFGCFSDLAKLEINNCSQLETIDLSNNRLTDLSFLSNLNIKKLYNLYLSNNDFIEQGLDLFQTFVNLENLFIDNNVETEDGDDEENTYVDNFEKGYCNRFIGSLEPLKNMSNLKNLAISNTDIDSGLEYLPNSLEEFYCSATDFLKPDSKVKKIEEELEKYGKAEWKIADFDYYKLLKVWKGHNPHLIYNTQQIIELEEILKNLNLALVKGKIEKEKVSKVLDIFIIESEEKIVELKKENENYLESKVQIEPK